MSRNPWITHAALLGFALGGFFDGILLHQILQWHHLLSLVPGMEDLRLQILWDGWFHALMYGLAVVALWGLWRARHCPAGLNATGGALLAGFGAWHMLDGILSHWLLGIHRIKLDSSVPLAWDLGFFLCLGLLPALLGWRLGRRPDTGGAPPAVTVAVLAAIGLGAGLWAAQPPAGQAFATIVFAPGVQPAAALERAGFAPSDVIWSDPVSDVTIARLTTGDPWRLYLAGALLVSGTGVPAGCFNWTRV